MTFNKTPLRYYRNARRFFYKGSLKYFISTGFFPRDKRASVTITYNFCRFVDDITDEQKDRKSLENVIKMYTKGIEGEESGNDIIDSFVALTNTYDINHEWTYSLFKSMEMDFDGRRYQTLDETLEWVYGVAEVVGLYMMRILELDDDSAHYARLLGRSAQWANNIRDIFFDFENGRSYFPSEDYDSFAIGENYLNKELINHSKYNEFINFQIDRYYKWQNEAVKGYKYIPAKLLPPIQTSTEIDNYKIEQIKRNPKIIYSSEVDVSKVFVLNRGVSNYSKRFLRRSS